MRFLVLAAALAAALPSAPALAQYGRAAPSYDEDDSPRYERPDYGRPRYDDHRRSDWDRPRDEDRGGRGFGGGPAPLYVGTVPNCNAAIVSAGPELRGCPARPIGMTAPAGPGARLYAGPGGVTVTPGGRSLGQLSASGRQELYVGTQPGCNQGVVTTNPRHLNCRTQAIGWTR